MNNDDICDNQINQTDVLICFQKIIDREYRQRIIVNNKITKCKERISIFESEWNEFSSRTDKTEDFFSPHCASNSKKNDKIVININRIKKELSEHTSELEEIDGNITNTNNMISYIKNNLSKLIKSKNFFSGNLGLSVLEIQESERKRIARELHDSTVQNLTNLAHKAELSSKLVDLDSIRTKLELQNMIDSVSVIINDMRTIIYNLRPMSLDGLGLVVTVEHFIFQMQNENKDLTIKLHTVNDEQNTLPVINLTLFRIIQEACHNANNHANADHIDITLIYNEKSIELIIIDNGVGFDKDVQDKINSETITSFGLSIMKERVYLLSGCIDIDSQKNKGTTIKVKVPMKIIREDKNETN